MFNNQSRSFLLTAVPEPSVLWVAGIAVGVFRLRLRRKRN
ncbi:MAG: PEP-CTERM sorting domain-containing protein [Chthonomonadaceae bacterium]|nr:PEP-CTERM sorting domain-containing protein [Chthonomonadaceae bacterium]